MAACSKPSPRRRASVATPGLSRHDVQRGKFMVFPAASTDSTALRTVIDLGYEKERGQPCPLRSRDVMQCRQGCPRCYESCQASPHYYSDLHATILHQLGLDHKKMEVQALGRTMKLVEEGGPIKEIIA